MGKLTARVQLPMDEVGPAMEPLHARPVRTSHAASHAFFRGEVARSHDEESAVQPATDALAQLAAPSVSQRGSFLLLISDDVLAQQLSGTAQRYSVVRRALCAREAMERVATNARWCGLIVDLEALGPEPLVALRQIREVHPTLSVLVLTPRADAPMSSGLHLLQCEQVVVPISKLSLSSFVRRALVRGWLPDERVAAHVDELAHARSLTAREVQIITYALGNQSRREVLRRLGVTQNTLKTQVRMLLRKCNAASVDGLAKSVLREALVCDDPKLG
jgi:DNA-binding NarL/FixJ family response regulator